MNPRFRSVVLPSPAARRGLGPVSTSSTLTPLCREPARTDHHADAVAAQSRAERAQVELHGQLQEILRDVAARIHR